MASGIIDCTGQVIKIGDRVKTPDGSIIEVRGGFISKSRMHNAEECRLVPKKTKLVTATRPTTKAIPSSTSKAALNSFDCVVWGT